MGGCPSLKEVCCGSLHEIDGAIGTGQKLLYFRQALRLGLADRVWVQLFLQIIASLANDLYQSRFGDAFQFILLTRFSSRGIKSLDLNQITFLRKDQGIFEIR